MSDLPSHPVSIQIAAPDTEPFPLAELPASFSHLIFVIAQRLGVDTATVRLTYTDPVSHKRLMLVGDSRYEEALKTAYGGLLLITVVLVPVIDVCSPSGHIDDRHNTDPKNHSFEEVTEALKRSPRTDSEAKKKRIRSIFENSQHFLSEKFKEVLGMLMRTLALPDEELDLSDARIGAYESVLVSEVMRMGAEIRRVKLANNHIENDSLITICQGLASLPTLEFLDLTNNQISGKGSHALSSTIRKLPKLQLLLLAGNRLKGDDIDAVLDAAPGMCRVVYDKKTDCEVM